MDYKCINFNYEKIDDNIKKIDLLSNEIKNKIVINKKIYGLNRKNNYSKYFDNKNLNKLENNICNGINDESIFEKSEKIIVNGYNCIKIKKDTKIYKYFSGFLEEDKIKYLLDRKDYFMYSYFSKYIAYSFIRLCFGGLVVFKIIDDIILFDYFDIDNIKIIIKIMNDIKPNNYLEIIDNIKYQTGYDKTLNDQIIYLNKYKNNIFIYNKIMIPKYNNVYKNIYYDNNLQPFRINYDISYLYYIDLKIFNIILNELPNIDGYIKKQLFSQLSPGGVYDYEELFIKPEIIIKKSRIDKEDKLSWYKLKNNNFNLQINILPNIFLTKRLHNKMSNNKNFKILKYYKKNIKNDDDKIKNFYNNNDNYNNMLIINILFNNHLDYIINKFDSINNLYEYINNINKLLNNKLEIIILYNFSNYLILYYETLFNLLYEFEYKIYIEKINSKFIILSKNKINNKIIDITFNYILDNNNFNYEIFLYPYFNIINFIKYINENSKCIIIYDKNKTITFVQLFNINNYNYLKNNQYKIINDIINNANKYIIDILLKENIDIIITNIYYEYILNNYTLINKKNKYYYIYKNNKNNIIFNNKNLNCKLYYYKSLLTQINI